MTMFKIFFPIRLFAGVLFKSDIHRVFGKQSHSIYFKIHIIFMKYNIELYINSPYMRYHTWILILYQIVYLCAIGCI